MDITLKAPHFVLLRRLANKEDIEDYQLATKRGGESSFGSVIAVTIKGKNKKKECILKAAFAEEVIRSAHPVRKAYLREMYVYENVFTVFEQFQERHGMKDGWFSAHPKYYGSDKTPNSETVVLESLSESGFKLWNCKEGMDGDHVSMILTQLAKLHSISLAMFHKDPELFEKLTQNLTNVFDTHSLAMSKCALEHGKKAVVGNELATAALERQSAIVEEFVCKDLEQSECKMAVIHNDGWCNNFMFKYEKSGKPVEVNIIDWQLTQKGSPIMDVSYFIFACGSPEVIKNFSEYLDFYYKVLKESMAQVSCDIGDVYPSNVFRDQWKKYSKFGLYMALIMIKIMLSEEGELTGIRQMAISGMSYVDRLNFESVNKELYNQRVSHIINVMAEHKLI